MAFVASRIDEGFDYAERMAEIRVELRGLDAEATELRKRFRRIWRKWDYNVG